MAFIVENFDNHESFDGGPPRLQRVNADGSENFLDRLPLLVVVGHEDMLSEHRRVARERRITLTRLHSPVE
jgi:hypothetical protein